MCGIVLLGAAALIRDSAPEAVTERVSASAPQAAPNLGYSELPDGRGGTNAEAIVYTQEMGFDRGRSLAAFEKTVYPILSTRCNGCHSAENTNGSGAQAPLHADVDVNLAHRYALTRVNFREPEESELVMGMAIDRHNRFFGSCETAAATMLEAVAAWRDAVADMLPEVPEESTKPRRLPRIRS